MSLTANNKIAVDVAERVNASRERFFAGRQKVARPVEELFPVSDRASLGLFLAYEQMGNRPVSEALEAEAERLGVTFEHLGLTIGTVIHGIDLRQTLSQTQIAFLRQVLLERKVIFAREQWLSEDQQVAFARYFGGLDAFPFGKRGDNPFIVEIHHDKDRPGVENGWHTDVTWMEQPSLGSVAQMIIAPPYGGDTLFSDSQAAYLGLPKAVQSRLQDVYGVHDYRLFLGKSKGALAPELVAEIKAQIPFGVSHPLLRTHPETGKTGLYIHGGFLRRDSLFDRRADAPLPATECQQLVSLLLAQHARPEYTCRFSWAAGSIAFWDNRAAQHYAVSDYYPHERLLRRVTISGDRPYYNPQQCN